MSAEILPVALRRNENTECRSVERCAARHEAETGLFRGRVGGRLYRFQAARYLRGRRQRRRLHKQRAARYEPVGVIEEVQGRESAISHETAVGSGQHAQSFSQRHVHHHAEGGAGACGVRLGIAGAGFSSYPNTSRIRSLNSEDAAGAAAGNEGLDR